jgi:hypothetical protein
MQLPALLIAHCAGRSRSRCHEPSLARMRSSVAPSSVRTLYRRISSRDEGDAITDELNRRATTYCLPSERTRRGRSSALPPA